MQSRRLFLSDIRTGATPLCGDSHPIKTDGKPLITFCVISYNHEEFIRQAIESALAQTYRPIQFIFSDDCSTDASFEIMSAMAMRHKGDAEILLNRNEKNLGTVDHLNKVFCELGKGRYFLTLAGDDMASPDRTEKVVDLLESTGASAVSVNPVMIDKEGKTDGKRFFSDFRKGVLHFEEFFLNGASFFGGGGYSRELFDIYGPMKNSARNEDTILPYRASTLGGIAYLGDPVYFYREHASNMSFWVKMKHDPQNKKRYEQAFWANVLQNLANFHQEVEESYRGVDKKYLLEQIESRIKWLQFERKFYSSKMFARPALVIASCRNAINSRQAFEMFLFSISRRAHRKFIWLARKFH